MKRYIRNFFLVYFAGFVLGSLCGNFLVREAGYQTSLLCAYLAAPSFLDGKELFLELLPRRGGYFLAGAFCGTTLLGFPLVFVSLLWFGFLAGNLVTSFLLEYGLKGMLLSGVCFFPQLLFYLPGWLFSFFLIAQMSRKSWEKKKRNREDYKAYCFFLLGAGILIVLGIWVESYVNQNLLKAALSLWK